MLSCSYKCITIPKLGNLEIENEDNILVPLSSEENNEKILKFAISDGATESSFSKEWSAVLVNGYKNRPFDSENLSSTIREISLEWHSVILSKLDKQIPWYVQQKLEAGAYATFLGVTLNLEAHHFDAVAIGDSVLFQIRDNEIVNSFPIVNLREFSNTPSLLSTNGTDRSSWVGKVKYLKDQIIEEGDLLVLVSDALAKWIFEKISKSENPWLILWLLTFKGNIHVDFKGWIEEKINKKEIKNDDISLIIIEFCI